MLLDEARHRSMCVGGARCRRMGVQYGIGSSSAGNTWSGVEEFIGVAGTEGLNVGVWFCVCTVLASSGGVNRFPLNDATNKQQPIFF